MKKTKISKTRRPSPNPSQITADQVLDAVEEEFREGIAGAKTATSIISRAQQIAHAQSASCVLDKFRPDPKRNQFLADLFKQQLGV